MRSCPACGSRLAKLKFRENVDLRKLDGFAYSSRKLPELMHRELHQCESCKTLFDPNVNSLAMLESLYNSAQFDSAEMADSAAQTYVDALLRFNLISGKTILDIGTGDGAFLLKAVKAGASEVTGIEPSEAAIAVADQRIINRIIHGTIENVDFGSQKFDTITFFMTIEHVSQPEKVAAKVHNLLNPGGTFAIVCHNRLSFTNRLLRKKSPIFDIEHIQILTKKGAKNFLQNNSFNNVRVVPLVNSYPAHYWLRLAPIPRKIKQSKYITNSKLFKYSIKLNVGNILILGEKIYS